MPAAMALTACMPPSAVQFDEPYAAAPADHAVDWHDYQAKTTTGTQQPPLSSRSHEESAIRFQKPIASRSRKKCSPAYPGLTARLFLLPVWGLRQVISITS